MSLKLWCVLSKDNTLALCEVAIDPTASVSSLKKAIHAEWASRLLKDVNAADLTLVRVCKAVLGGMTKKELKQSKEALSLTSYGDDPEDPDVDDDVSVFNDAPGVCLKKDAFLFKVMNSMTKVSCFAGSLPDDLCHVLVLMPTSSVETVSPAFTFKNSISVPMTAEGLWDWVHESPANSSENISGSEIVSQDNINKDISVLFPLAGRKSSLQHIASCFSAVYANRHSTDRNTRPIPVCSGVPGLGKTRLLKECATTVMDMTGIDGMRLSVIISFGTDGNRYGSMDDYLGIQCSFAWRVLHSFFKAQHKFEKWMLTKSPTNRKELTLDTVLSTIEFHWAKKFPRTKKFLVFLGIDEYQQLGSQENLNLLLDSLCDSSCISKNSRVALFLMLAGTDPNMTRIARTSHASTKRIPISFLTHAESMHAIGPYISSVHPGFVVSDAFAQNVYYLGGVPRLLTKFAELVVNMDLKDLLEIKLRLAREEVLLELAHPQLSVADTLKLLAISFTNTPIKNLLVCPFKNSLVPSAQSWNWNQMVSHGICLVQEGGCIRVPFHVVHQLLSRTANESDCLDEYQLALLSSLDDLSKNVEVPLPNVPSWLSWESFGAHFYCLRINSFLVLGRKKLALSDLLRGAQFNNSAVFETQVQIQVANVFKSNEAYGPELQRNITHTELNSNTSDWLDGEILQVVLNREGATGVDIFFALKCADNDGYIVVLDQRKRLASEIHQADLSTYKSKVPEHPTFLKNLNVKSVLGLMSIYSKARFEKIPNSTFIVSAPDSGYFHGSLVDHPGCSIAIDVNSGLKTSIQQLFVGTQQKRKEWSENIIEHRKKGRIQDAAEFRSAVEKFGGNLDELALQRMTF
ncbi:hypothetical protein BDR26DRAFT_940618 [Obelidium mucronatum]|nr:hypothetical protein BDR26DRAFT_940618 [Obelidium mucronatum]